MRSLALAAALVAGIFTAEARAEVIEQFQAEDWGGLAYADDDTGAFHNCIVFASYRSGATLMMIRTVENSWTVAFAHDDWQVTPGNSYRLQYKFDRRRAVQAAAEALSASQLSIAGDARLIDQLRRGRLLTITFEGRDYVFELSNSAKALKAAEDCVERHRGRVVQQAAAPADAPPGKAEQAAAGAQGAGPEAAELDATAQTTDASAMGERQEFGHWAVTATDDGAGNFVNCTAFGLEGGSDEQLILSYTPEGRWEFGLYRADWSLDTDGSYILLYNVDRSVDEPGVMRRPVEAVEPSRIFFEVSALETLMERAAGGRQLYLQLHGPGMEPQDLSYSLDRAGEALEAAKACVAGYLAADDMPSTQAEEPAPSATALPPLGDREIEGFTVPGWEAGAYADASGRFTHCTIRATYQNGSTLAFSRTADDALVMALARSDWSLPPGQATPIKYQVTWETAPNVIGITSGGLERHGEAEAVDASLLAIEIGGDERFVERLWESQRLNVETQDRTLAFNIDDLPPGLEAIGACRQRHLAAAQAPADGPQPRVSDGASLPPLGEQEVESFPVPGWEGGAYADAAGRFTHCSVRANYQNGTVLAFARTADKSLLLALARSDWTLRPREWSPIRFSYGKDFPINNDGEAQAVDATVLATNMGREDPFIDQLRQAPMLTVEAEGRSLSFDISDLAPGLDAIDACRERHLAAAAAPSGKAAAAASAETAQAEGARYVTDLLKRSGYADLHMLVGDNRPEGFESYDVVWEVGEILGMLTVQPAAEGLTLTQVRNKIIADDAASCEGEFSTGTLASQGGSSIHLYSACKTAETEFSVFYAIVPRERGGFYVVMHIGLGDGEAARAISSKVHQTALS